MPHTDKDEVLADAIFNILLTNRATLGLDDVLYGNHINFPLGKTAIVQALGKRRSLAGVSAPGGRTENILVVNIDIQWSKVGDENTERRAIDNMATAVETLLHSDTTVNGTIIHGFITQVDRGETGTNNGMFRTVKMTFSGKTKTNLSV